MTEYQGLRCLVTGGAGFIGSNLTRRLIGSGAEVTVLDDLSTGNRQHLQDLLDLQKAAPLRFVEADLRSTPLLGELVAESDVVFHLAAQVGNVKSIAETETDAATNVMGTVRLLRACRDAALRRVVYSSSSATFGEAATLPIAEDHPQRPESFYALSKWTAERYAVLAHELWRVPTVCLRYFNVFGLPMEDSEYTGVISIFFRRLLAGEPLTVYGNGDALRDYVFVDDVVAANLLAGLHGAPGRVYNIGSGKGTTVVELADAMREVTGRDSATQFAPARAGEVRRSLADISRARAELGYEPRWDLRAGLRAMWARVGVMNRASAS